MGLIDEATAGADSPNCRVSQIRGQLPEEEREEFDELLERHDIASNTIIAVLGRRGIGIANNTLNKHRYGKNCACYRGNLKAGRRGGSK